MGANAEARAVQTSWRSSNAGILPLLNVPSSKRGANGGVGHVPAGASFIHRRPPSIYESSPGCTRGFCPRCGTQISFTAEYIPGLIDITIGSLDSPEEVPPTFHYWESKRLPWLLAGDALPRHAEFPPTM